MGVGVGQRMMKDAVPALIWLSVFAVVSCEGWQCAVCRRASRRSTAAQPVPCAVGLGAVPPLVGAEAPSFGRHGTLRSGELVQICCGQYWRRGSPDGVMILTTMLSFFYGVFDDGTFLQFLHRHCRDDFIEVRHRKGMVR